ncbi:MAG TPA: hypothetical protein VM490_04685, partial [Armatimonadaceae bacterium]|nr:hypothetical protein [Armatimonadaceae bacterium]
MPGRKNSPSKNGERREQTTPQGRFANAWPPAGDADRQALLKNIARAPVGYGTWRDLKALYKQAEQAALADPASADAAVLGALMGRIDAAPRIAESRQAPKATLTGVHLNTVASLTALDDGRVVVVGNTYQSGAKRRVALLASDPADPLKPEVAGMLDLEYSYGGQTVRSAPGWLFLAEGTYQGTNLQVIKVAGGGEGGADGDRPLTLGATHEVRGSELLAFDCAALPGGGGVRGVLLVKTGRGRQEKARLDVLDLTPGAGGDGGVRTLGQVEIGSASAAALSPDGRFAIVGTGGSGFSWSSLPKPGGLRVYDLSDPAKPRQVGAMPLENVVSILAGGPADAPLVYVTCTRKNDRHPNGVYVISLGTPAWPRQVGFVETQGAGGRLYFHPQRPDLLFACPYWGGSILDISNPAAPKVLRQGSEPSLNISAASGDILWTAESYGGGIAPWYFADAAHPVRLGTPVSAATLGYMKRRIRRTLDELAGKDPARYAETAAQMLVSVGRTAANVSPSDHWATMDALFGNGGRYAQKNHGRGAYAPVKDAPRFSLRRREERHPEIWDAHPEAASTLVTTKETPSEAREMALKVLRNGRHPLPAPNASTLERMLTSGMPLQTALAVRLVTEAAGGRKKISPAAAADAYRLAGAARRRQIEAGLEASLADATWADNFARHALAGLDRRAGESEGKPLSRRDATLLGLLFRAAPGRFGLDAHRP